MNQEGPNERHAKEIVEKTLGVRLQHADKNGGVDYRSAEGSTAVEVTRVTDEYVRQGLRAWSESEKAAVPGAAADYLLAGVHCRDDTRSQDIPPHGASARRPT